MKVLKYILIMIFFFTTSCENESEWIYLFDGSNLEGWRAYNGASLPSDWSIEEGSLTFNKEAKNEANYEGGKNIIFALEKFENFELFLEWKVSEGGNSGVFYHLQEGFKKPSEV